MQAGKDPACASRPGAWPDPSVTGVDMRECLTSLAINQVLRQGMAAYFLAKAPLTAALHYLLALAAVLFVIWPKSQYLRVGSPPLTFSILAIVATLIMAYLGFSYGAGRPAEEMPPPSRAWLVEVRAGPSGAVVGFTVLTMAHTLFFIILALPLLISAAHVSGITPQNFGRALLLMVTCTLAYRWMGLLAFCVWEEQEFMRYVVARVAFVVFVLGSAFFLPPMNPLLGLISMSFGEELGQMAQVFGQQLSYATVSLIIHLLLLLGAYIMVLMLLQRWLQSPSGRAPSGEEGGLPDRRGS
jgi:hypothetical protein